MTKRRTLQLDKERKKFLGVCAGLARYMDVNPLHVRLVFVGGTIFGGWFLVPLYFAAWFLLDDASEGVRHSLTDNLAVKHFRTVDYRKKIYRNTRDAKWLGVCAGIADYLEVNVFAIRMVFLLLFFTTGGFPLLFYIAAWMVLDKRPEEDYEDAQRGKRSQAAASSDESADAMAEAAAAETESWAESQVEAEDLREELRSKRREIKYCARKFMTLQTRLARMEAYVTSSRFKLHREFRTIS